MSLKQGIKIDETFKMEVAEMAIKECTIAAQKKSPWLLKEAVAKKKKELHEKIDSGPVAQNKLQNNSYFVRAKNCFQEFQKLANELAENEEMATDIEEKLQQVDKRIQLSSRKTKLMRRALMHAFNPKRYEMYADQFTEEYEKMTNNYLCLEQEFNVADAKRDREKNGIDKLKRKMAQIAEGVIPIKESDDIDVKKLGDGKKSLRQRLVILGQRKEFVEENVRGKRDDIAKNKNSADSLNKHIESTKSSVTQTEEDTAKLIAESRQLKESLNSERDTLEQLKTHVDEDSVQKSRLASKLKELRGKKTQLLAAVKERKKKLAAAASKSKRRGAPTIDPEPAKRRRVNVTTRRGRK